MNDSSCYSEGKVAPFTALLSTIKVLWFTQMQIRQQLRLSLASLVEPVHWVQ